MLILEAHPFLVDSPPSWGKLKMHKVGLLTGNITFGAKLISHEPPRAVGRGLYSNFIVINLVCGYLFIYFLVISLLVE